MGKTPLLLVESSSGTVHVRITPVETEKGPGLEVLPVNGLPIQVSPGDTFHLVVRGYEVGVLADEDSGKPEWSRKRRRGTKKALK